MESFFKIDRQVYLNFKAYSIDCLLVSKLALNRLFVFSALLIFFIVFGKLYNESISTLKINGVIVILGFYLFFVFIRPFYICLYDWNTKYQFYSDKIVVESGLFKLTPKVYLLEKLFGIRECQKNEEYVLFFGSGFIHTRVSIPINNRNAEKVINNILDLRKDLELVMVSNARM